MNLQKTKKKMRSKMLKKPIQKKRKIRIQAKKYNLKKVDLKKAEKYIKIQTKNEVINKILEKKQNNVNVQSEKK